MAGCRKVRIGGIVLSLLASLFVAPSAGHAATAHRAQVSTQSDGLSLTIATPRSAYPPDALMPVAVTLRNISNAGAHLELCGGFLPVVQLLNAAGQVVNQPSIPEGLVHPACFDPTVPGPVPAGTTATWTGLVLLRTHRLRASVDIYGPGSRFTDPTTHLVTPVLGLKSVHVARTQAEIVTAPQLHADVQDVAGKPIFYSDRLTCTDAGGATTYGGTHGWTRASSTSIMPSAVQGCVNRTRWQVAVAVEGQAPVWLDHSIVQPSLPAGSGITAPACATVPSRRAAVAAIWHQALFIVRPDGTACRLVDNAEGDIHLSPDGRWVVWSAPEAARPRIRDLWVGRADGRTAPTHLAVASFSTRQLTLLWAPGSRQFVFWRGGSLYLVRPASDGAAERIPLDAYQMAPLAWFPNGAGILVQVFGHGGGPWIHVMNLERIALSGAVQQQTVRFPDWLSNPNARPIGSYPMSWAQIAPHNTRLLLATAGGGVRVSGIWSAPATAGATAARLIVGTEARVRGSRTPVLPLDRATHPFSSPDGRYVAADPWSGFWIDDTGTNTSRMISVPSQPGCAISQETWMADDRGIAYVQTCHLAVHGEFRSTLWAVMRAGGAPRLLLSAVDRQLDSISIGPVYR